MAEETLVQVTSLHRYYGTVHAVKGIEFQSRRGEVVGLLGPNGAGKSTTLGMLAGTIAPSAGQVLIKGHDLEADPIVAKRQIGYLPERPPLYPELTVDEYLDYCAALSGLERLERQDGVSRAKYQCNLTKVGRRLIGNLSKGFQQRVGIAQAIAHTPEVVILDEPTAGLDPLQVRDIRQLIAELALTRTVIVSSHILSEIHSTCTRVLLIDGGELILDRRLDELSAPRVRARFHQRPSLEALSAVEGVRTAEFLGPDGVHIESDDSTQLGAALVHASAARDWGLWEVTSERSSLEETFIRMTGAQAPH